MSIHCEVSPILVGKAEIGLAGTCGEVFTDEGSSVRVTKLCGKIPTLPNTFFPLGGLDNKLYLIRK